MVFERDGKQYEVQFKTHQVFDEVCIYRRFPNHLFFRRMLLETYLSAVQECQATVALRLDRSADDFLARVAEFTLDEYLDGQRQQEAAVQTRKRQLEYMARM